ncbi:hypothetical protein LOZ12_002657 [Ophidiomyces ophidiicola]|uniref:Uncharacterized protein n=1 Tax=Ophidiomyces ophidiicola TaxID=1387563 RepID=A0ACB8UX74_9EURO|nr:hypothetical protein LOZ62_003336 [Ophidiomyces ophidiicola]KAI1967487.1 hypothetical protein LOZ56_005614 [Ophidiomyces ophidiicola]KAI2004862.1 hypothetical protein LOZ50_004029 [Ophidiomyces ophidiicola]KAI2018225.1 hypothetical protein LOZ46_003970 [Ophidiomyces ophidiicola]KAI2048648.1 hypothetical protein LOZ38_004253 [Ophidiomyces ophidiicola]
MFRLRRFQARCLWQAPCRYNSTAPITPPLLASLRGDLKTAMKARDTVRLDVLRAIIAEVNNAAKTQSPIQTDLQLLALIRKRSTSLEAASEEFVKAGRSDLKVRNDAEISVLVEYAGQVSTMSPDEIQSAVSQTIEQLKSRGKKVDIGTVMRTAFAPGGPLHEKPAEKSIVSKMAAQAISA